MNNTEHMVIPKKKTWWKRLPYWVKGGIIALLIQLILFLLVTFSLLLAEISDIFFGIGALLAVLIFFPTLLGIENDFLGFIVGIILYLLIGMLIGIIISKVKKK